MRHTPLLSLILGLLLLVPASSSARPAAAQSGVSAVQSSDIQKLQDRLTDIRSNLTTLRAQDPSRADQLMTQFNTLQDDVTYLRVKLQKEGRVTHQEYGDLSGRIADFQMQVTGAPVPSRETRQPAPTREAPVEAPAPSPSRARAEKPVSLSDVPVGTEVDVTLQSSISSATASVEDKVEATTAVDLKEDNHVLIPAGSVMRGVVSSVTKATRTDRKGQLTISFDRITVNGTIYQMHGTVAEASEGIKGEKAKIGTGAGVGAILGGLLGGFKGALAGILIGGGGMVAATPGKDVELPAGTTLRVKIDSPLTVARGGALRN